MWVDDICSFGTYPLESMACGVPVIGKAPSLVPDWISENNGIWIQEKIRLQDILADFIQNWLEDNVSESLYNGGIETADRYKNQDKFKNTIESLFIGYSNIRIENFQSELNKQQIEEKA